jgi:hypothetical protein
MGRRPTYFFCGLFPLARLGKWCEGAHLGSTLLTACPVTRFRYAAPVPPELGEWFSAVVLLLNTLAHPALVCLHRRGRALLRTPPTTSFLPIPRAHHDARRPHPAPFGSVPSAALGSEQLGERKDRVFAPPNSRWRRGVFPAAFFLTHPSPHPARNCSELPAPRTT